MRESISATYWAIVGALVSFGGLAAFTVGPLFLLMAFAMAFLGLFKMWLKGFWAVTLGLGGVPMAILLKDVVDALISPGPPCTPAGSVSLSADAGEGASASCSVVLSGGYTTLLIFLAAIALSGIVWRLFLRGRFS